jgi:hypothetical protein
MKKLLMGTIILFLFSISIVIVQTSCSKSEAQTGQPNQNSLNQLNKILYVNFNGEVWTSNYDGTNATQVIIALPINVNLELSTPRFSVKLSPDGQKIFFSGSNSATNESGIYSCDISGNNVIPIHVSTGGTQPILTGVY